MHINVLRSTAFLFSLNLIFFIIRSLSLIKIFSILLIIKNTSLVQRFR